MTQFRYCLLVTVTLITLGIVPTAQARGPIPIHPATAWANTYLLNTLFSAELVSYERYLSNAALKPQVTPQKLQELLTRARFATVTAKDRGQALVPDQLYQRALSTITKEFGKPAPELPSDTEAGVAKVQASFDRADWRNRFEQLAEGYQLGAPRCRMSKKKVKTFIQHQQNLLAKDSAINSLTLLKPIEKYSLDQLRCLVFAMMSLSVTHPDKGEYDPLHLMQALRQTSSPLARDIPIRIMLAIRLLHHHNYAETLRVLLDLRDQNPSYRLAYDLVQNIYSLRQKGQGAVSLRGP